MSERTYETAWARLYEALRAIRGSAGGFRNDLEGRVLDELVTPAKRPGLKLPYVCIPVLGRWEPPVLGDTFVEHALQLDATGFCPLRESKGPLVPTPPPRILSLFQDMVLAVMPNSAPLGSLARWNLGERLVDDVSIGGPQFVQGAGDGVLWDEVTVPYRVAIRFSRADAYQTAA